MMANVQFTINNNSGSNVTYQGQVIPTGNSYTPSAAAQNIFASDPGLIADILNNKTYITIGNNTLNSDGAIKLLSVLSSTTLVGATDLTRIGNSGDRLKTEITAPSSLSSPLGRFRIAEHSVFFNFSFKRGYLENDLYFDKQLTSGGTITTDTNKASILLNSTSTIGSKVIAQTFRYFPYFPGRGTDITITGNFKGAITGIRKRYGYFDDKDGIFFQLNDSNFSIVKRSYTGGSVVDTSVNQSDWNIDKLDGTGLSGKTLDLTKQTIFTFDYLWLGSGPIRVYIWVGNEKLPVHEFQHSNLYEGPWASTTVLPIRAEIENLSGNAASSLRLTCMAISYEGKNEKDAGLDHFHASSGTNEVTITTDTPVWSIRLNPNANRTCIIPMSTNLIMTSGTKVIHWKLIKNATLTGPSWETKGYQSQIDTISTTASGGTVCTEGYINIGGATTVSPEILLGDNELFIGRKIDGTSEILTLVASTAGGTAKFVWDLKVREYLL